MGPGVNNEFDVLRSTGSGFTREDNYIPGDSSNLITTDLLEYCAIYSPHEEECLTINYHYDQDKARNIRFVDVTGDGLADLVSGPRPDDR
ncbi:MAG: hypothetical protein DRQ59_05410 [Gammaproteobacteria bacterium]|nr:MAG: hypothetical protein DRQ59_05410 [Gammaproteobacteria bacterium]